MSNKTVWVLTREINQYDQDGEYFVAVFSAKPTTLLLADTFSALNVDCGETNISGALAFYERLAGGGGRSAEMENEWFHLREVTLRA